jgi:hypothetical protein
MKLHTTNKAQKYQYIIFKVVTLIMGTCTAAGIVAIEFLTGNLAQIVHFLSTSSF